MVIANAADSLYVGSSATGVPGKIIETKVDLFLNACVGQIGKMNG